MPVVINTTTTGSMRWEWPSASTLSTSTTFTVLLDPSLIWSPNNMGDWQQTWQEFGRVAVRAATSQRRREEADRQERNERQERMRAARIRAEETLMLFLDDENRQRYGREGHILVTGSAGGRYRIRRGYQGNVDRLNEHGLAIERYCAHPRMTVGLGGERMPDEDAMITQLLKLQTDEPGFLAIANVTCLT